MPMDYARATAAGTHKHTRTPTPSEEHKSQSQRISGRKSASTISYWLLFFRLKYFANDGCRLQDAELFRYSFVHDTQLHEMLIIYRVRPTMPAS